MKKTFLGPNMKTYIFDLDGVLIDSKHMMEQSWNLCELEHELTQPFSEYFKYIGLPFRDILTNLGINENHDAISSVILIQIIILIYLKKLIYY